MPSLNREEQDPLQPVVAEILEAKARGDVMDRDALIQAYPDHADWRRGFFANHDRLKSAAEIDSQTLPPSKSLEEPTIQPVHVDEDATIPPAPSQDAPTVPPTEAASSAPPPSVGNKIRYFGDYELLEEIAYGGMGVVYKARQINLNRIVALKVILAGQFAGREDVQRIYTKAEATGQLDHPGFVPIFEIGEHLRKHYFSVGYVEGDSLAQIMADGPQRNALFGSAFSLFTSRQASTRIYAG